MIIDTQSIACPLCGHNDAKRVDRVVDSLREISARRWDLMQCGRCSLVYVYPQISREEWLALHDQPHSYYSSSSQNSTACLRRISTYVPGTIMDVGCGQGDFLQQAQNQGWTIDGVEVSDKIPNPHRLPIRYGDFNTMDLPLSHYDLVTFWGVTEYLLDPIGFFNKVRAIVKENGRILFVAGNYYSIQRKIMGVHNIPRQRFIWSLPAIRYLFNMTGLEIVSIDYNNDVRNGRATELITFLFKQYVLNKTKEQIVQEHNNPRSIPWWLIPVKVIDRMITIPLSAIMSMIGYNGVMNITAQKK
jgi:SAM-dependent methyltransferase